MFQSFHLLIFDYLDKYFAICFFELIMIARYLMSEEKLSTQQLLLVLSHVPNLIDENS